MNRFRLVCKTIGKRYSAVKFDFDMEKNGAKLNFPPNVLLIFKNNILIIPNQGAWVIFYGTLKMLVFFW